MWLKNTLDKENLWYLSKDMMREILRNFTEDPLGFWPFLLGKIWPICQIPLRKWAIWSRKLRMWWKNWKN
jgi:hypothetical protein